MKRLIYILLFVPFGLLGQAAAGSGLTFPVQAYNAPISSGPCSEATSKWSFENTGTDSIADNDISANGGALYSASYSADGSYSGSINATGAYFSIPSIDYGDEFTLIFEARFGSATHNTLYSAISSNDGFEIYIDGSGADIYVQTGNGSSNNYASALDCGISTGTFHSLAFVFDRTNGTCEIYVDGTKETTDNSILTDFENETTARMGLSLAGYNQYWGHVDAVQFYEYKVSSTGISTINTTPGTVVCE